MAPYLNAVAAPSIVKGSGTPYLGTGTTSPLAPEATNLTVVPDVPGCS